MFRLTSLPSSTNDLWRGELSTWYRVWTRGGGTLVYRKKSSSEVHKNEYIGDFLKTFDKCSVSENSIVDLKNSI